MAENNLEEQSKLLIETALVEKITHLIWDKRHKNDRLHKTDMSKLKK